MAWFTVALGTLLLTIWGMLQISSLAELGFTWSSKTGVINWLAEPNPFPAILQPGVRILSVEGVPVQQVPALPSKTAGETIELVIVNEAGEAQLLTIPLADPSAMDILARVEPLIIALTFWVLSVIVLFFSDLRVQARLLFLSCQAGCAVLVSGALSAFGLPGGPLFGLLLWWLGPLVIHLHLHFPYSRPPNLIRRWTLILYGGAFIGSLLDEMHLLSSSVYTARYLWLVAGLTIMLVLLVNSYQYAPTAESRRQVRVVALGGLVAVLPLIVFSLLPDAMWHQPILAYELSFLFLITLPLAYGYAILRYRLIHLERYISRSTTYILVFLILSGLYIFIYALLQHTWQLAPWQYPIINLLITLILAAAFSPLHRRVNISINRAVYGGWSDYQLAVQRVSQALNRTIDSPTLAETLCQEIQTAMQLECACLLLPDGPNSYSVCTGICPRGTCQIASKISTTGMLIIQRWLQSQNGPLEASLMQEVAARLPELSAVEKQLLSCEYARLWIPMHGHIPTSGVLILGERRGGGILDRTNLEILEVLVQQASMALENTYLIAELRQRMREGERLHRQILSAGEEERKRVARELHDQIIQELVGLNYHLSELRASPFAPEATHASQLQDEVRRILGEVRRICTDLRPPALDSLGLISAVRSRLREMEKLAAFEIVFNCDSDDIQDLPDETALCTYRVLQEALLNVQKHAAAKRIEVTLRLSPDQIELIVQDDGRGFYVPSRLGQLTDESHFGLVGLSERLELLSGTLNIISTPGQGTQLKASLPRSLTSSLVVDA
ncbi:two-component system, NarL family, sensor histidine kinase ComP [Thermoflexales bacterium]|nr:two-component system, NarL family, sensor histidine kinase ComP [Thermoflexales bacterium]